MSVRIENAATYAVTRAADFQNRAKAAPTAGADAETSAPEREVVLTRQLEDRLNTEIARIRQRVDSPNKPDRPESAVESAGRRLDIRA